MATHEVNIRNKKAKFDYDLIDKYDAGIQLTGAEIKSVRGGKASIAEAYCFFRGLELWIKGMHISPYEPASYNNPSSPVRDRKLLLQKKELEKLKKALNDKGLTIVPLRVYIGQSGYAKVQISLARGKKRFDKRQDLKEKQDKRAMDRAMKI